MSLVSGLKDYIQRLIDRFGVPLVTAGIRVVRLSVFTGIIFALAEAQEIVTNLAVSAPYQVAALVLLAGLDKYIREELRQAEDDG